MANFITVKQAAELWGMKERTVANHCAKGNIPGAEKVGKRWQIPDNAAKPTSGEVGRPAAPIVLDPYPLPLPIGVSDFKRATDEYYYVDKTLFLKEFLKDDTQVALFTRPRRFGKTLNMDMARVFFEKTDQYTMRYFLDKHIGQCGWEYMRHQGKYPVIFLTFKDCKWKSWESTLQNIRDILGDEFTRHKELANSPLCSEQDLRYYKAICNGEVDETKMAGALKVLSRMLSMHYGEKAVIIVDEYDTPVEQGYIAGFYEDVILFMRNFFSGGLKDNPHLAYGLLTGILRISQESIFSGLNNLRVYSILDEKYREFFGFKKEEVRLMAEYYGVPEKYRELCEWYDGYMFGGMEIFNPWSVINYFANDCKPQAYWVSTSRNDIIKTVLKNSDTEIVANLIALLKGESVSVPIETNVVFPELEETPVAVYSMLLLSGYLKVVSEEPSLFYAHQCEVTLPNREIRYVYHKEIIAQLQKDDTFPKAPTYALLQAFTKGDSPSLEAALRKFLMETVSYHDAANEAFYHGLILGLCAIFSSAYELTSNRESGTGRFDIQLKPRETDTFLGTPVTRPGILIEVKSVGSGGTALQSAARKALAQIAEKKYDTELKAAGVSSVLKYGVAFHGKEVAVEVEN